MASSDGTWLLNTLYMDKWLWLTDSLMFYQSVVECWTVRPVVTSHLQDIYCPTTAATWTVSGWLRTPSTSIPLSWCCWRTFTCRRIWPVQKTSSSSALVSAVVGPHPLTCSFSCFALTFGEEANEISWEMVAVRFHPKARKRTGPFKGKSKMWLELDLHMICSVI